MDTASETTLSGPELHEFVATILNPLEGAKNPAAITEKKIQEPKISSAPHCS